MDNYFIHIWISPEGMEDDLENWIKIVFEHWQFNSPYLSFKQMKKMHKEYKEKGFDFDGLSVQDLKVVLEIMECLESNLKEIQEMFNYPTDSTAKTTELTEDYNWTR